VRPLEEQVVGDTAGVLWVLSGMIGIVMFISWANVASVSLVQAEQRRHDVMVRLALGAASHRLARELLLESGLLGALAGALGVSLAFAAVRVLVALAPASLPRVDEIGIGPVELAFALTLAILSSLLLGGIQVVRHLGPTSQPSLHVTDRTSSGSRPQQLTRNSLVVAQVSLALVLVVGAGLMVRTFLALRAVQPGFTTSTDIQLARITIPVTVAEDPERVFRMQRDIVDRLSALPGAVAASLSSAAPMEPFISANTVLAEHQGDNTGKTRRFKFVSPGYFTTVGTPLVAGREFTWDDLDQRRPVAVISENMAREIWRQPEAAVGRRIRENPQGPWREIIGVVSNVFDDGVDAPPPAIAYWPALLDNFEGDRVRVRRSVTLIVRSNRAGTEGLLDDVQRTVWSVNANLPLSRVRTLRTLYDGSLARTSFTLVMLAIAASMALLFGIVGIYGTIAYAVAQRTREIGIRLALGAPPRDVRRMFIRQGVVLAGLGVAIGAVAATALTRLMSSLLFGVSAIDPGTYLVASLGLMTAASIASYIPAQRATAVDPVRTLRSE
jgi:predicted permease